MCWQSNEKNRRIQAVSIMLEIWVLTAALLCMHICEVLTNKKQLAVYITISLPPRPPVIRIQQRARVGLFHPYSLNSSPPPC